MGLFDRADANPARAPWHRERGTTLKVDAALQAVLDRFGLAVRIRAAEAQDPPRYPVISGDVGGAHVTIRVEEREGVWVRELSVEVQAYLPAGLVVRRRQAGDVAIFERVEVPDRALAELAWVEAVDGGGARRWLGGHLEAVRRLVDLDAELAEGWLWRRKTTREGDVPWIAASIEGLLDVAGRLG